ncbi:hypothetical protein NYZ99_06920 [Maribacter litopenaei]|uniref:VCBS repeat-containing protein n=1 Tax=Maribacter litopenaei TaxID=2976127 RepID=A0ABY5YAZ3_9FLAO|nr:hypothetical protein [Maribacter litopenaei]UWX56043.1 hypothetical protein NYZ99_06920 [Maribacter litopenaei]
MNGQSPLFRSKYTTYKGYAKADINTLFNKKELEGANTFTGNYDRSVYLENLGNGKFNLKELPWEAQMAPINSIAITDYNDDGHDDVLLVGNDYGNEVFIGKYDASNGFLLEGDGKGNFTIVDIQKSGFITQGDTKDITIVKNATGNNPFIVVSQNRGPLKVFLKNE